MPKSWDYSLCCIRWVFLYAPLCYTGCRHPCVEVARTSIWGNSSAGECRTVSAHQTPCTHKYTVWEIPLSPHPAEPGAAYDQDVPSCPNSWLLIVVLGASEGGHCHQAEAHRYPLGPFCTSPSPPSFSFWLLEWSMVLDRFPMRYGVQYLPRIDWLEILSQVIWVVVS